MFNLGTLGGLFVSLGVDTAQFEGDMGKAASIAQRQGERISAAAGAIGATVAAGAAAAAGALGMMIKHTIDAADELSKLSARTGFGVEALSELKFAAGLADVSMGQLSSSLGFFNKAIAEAHDPTSRQAQLFKALGVDISQGAQPAFDQFMKGINELPSHEQKVAAMRMAFGRAGDALLQMSEDLDKTRQRARDMGIVISEDLAKKSNKAKDDLSAVAQSLNLIGIAAAGPVVEYLGNVAAALSRAAEQGGIFNGMVREGFKLMGALASVIPAFWWMEGPVQKAFDEDVLGIGKPVKGKIRGVAGVPEVNAEMTACVVSGGNWVNGKCQREKPKKGRALTPEQQFSREYVEDALDQAKTLSEAKALTEKYGPMFEQQAQGEKIIKDVFDEIQQQQLQQIDIENELSDIRARAAAGFDANGNKIKENLSEQKSLARDLGLTFQSAFEDAVIGGEKFSNVLKSLAMDLAKLAVRKTVTEPLMGVFSGVLSGIFGGGGGGSEWGPLVSDRRASGGPVSPGQTYMVGERGPELFVPSVSGTIVPNDSMGGGGPVFNIDARGADVAAVQRLEAMVMQLHGTFNHRAVAAVRNSTRRGG